MAFQRFTESGRSFKARISIRKNGQIGFSNGAVKKFGLQKFSHVVLFYDADKKRIGIKPTNDSEEEGAYKLNIKETGASVAGLAFIDYFDIPHENTQKYEAKWDDESQMIIVDLT